MGQQVGRLGEPPAGLQQQQQQQPRAPRGSSAGRPAGRRREAAGRTAEGGFNVFAQHGECGEWGSGGSEGSGGGAGQGTAAPPHCCHVPGDARLGLAAGSGPGELPRGLGEARARPRERELAAPCSCHRRGAELGVCLQGEM